MKKGFSSRAPGVSLGQSPNSILQSSGPLSPCPCCGRKKDNDCRISNDRKLVLCHYGATHHPPLGLKPGDVMKGSDGQRWAFTKNANDERVAVFTLDKPKHMDLTPHLHTVPRREASTRSETNTAPVNGHVELAKLPAPGNEPPEHLPHGYRLDYSGTQWVKVSQDANEKKYRPWHRTPEGKEVNAKGPAPWSLWRGTEAIEHGPGRWVAEAEGEKCADWLRAGGVVGISQPGHDHTAESIRCRYERLAEAGLAGVVYLADHGFTGRAKADRCKAAAAAAQLPFLVLHSIDLWPDVPDGGSIDDASGTAAERVQTIRNAIPSAHKRATQQPLEAAAAQTKEHGREEMAPMLAERITAVVKGYLGATLRDDHSEIDAYLSQLYRLGVGRERAQERLLFLWAESHGYQLSPGAGEVTTRGRMFGKAEGGKGLRQLLPGFLLDRDLHLLVSNASGGKTVASAELATVMSTRDGGFLDHEAPRTDLHDDQRRTVLVIASDGEASAFDMWDHYLQELRAKERRAKIELWAQDDETGERAWNVSLRNLERLVQRLTQGDVSLVIIDTANAVLRGAGVNVGVGPIETYLRLLKQIVCRHCALWITHHTTRAGTPDLKGIGGHPAFQEVPSVIHMIEVKNRADGSQMRIWHVLKLRGSDYRRFAYELRDGELRITEGHLYENCAQQILAALHNQLGHKADTAPGDLVNVTGRPTQSVYNALAQLRGAKLIRRHGNGYRITPAGKAELERLRI
jgi:hypothetical protein